LAFGQRQGRSGSKTVETTVHVAYIKFRNPDGSYTTVRDLELPARITPISATVANPFRIKVAPQKQQGLNLFANMAGRPMMPTTVVYQNDSPSVQYVVGETVNSALDDLSFDPQSVDKAWKLVSHGVHLSLPGRTGKFLVRWRAYKTFVPGLGPGNMAFFDEMFDVGFYLQRSQFVPNESTFRVDIDFTQSPFMILEQEDFYLAQQFREPITPETGEGPFSQEWNVFCDNGPQVGSSEDIFWFDIEPNGIYDETEADLFEVPGAANFLFKVEVSTTATQFLQPASFQWTRGQHLTGGLSSLWFDNGVYMTARAGATFPQSSPLAQLEVLTFSPEMNPGGLRFDVDSKVNTSGLTMTLELYNWFTESWTQIYSGAATTTDSRVTGVVQFPFLYVNEDAEILGRVAWRRTGPIVVFPWTVSVDQTQWVVTSSN
jgi:hypothetical protein